MKELPVLVFSKKPERTKWFHKIISKKAAVL
jgi:hypothetical protein